jgi:hypothetical protein
MSDEFIHSLTAAGILHLYSVFSGDHNACYIDVDGVLLFANSITKILLLHSVAHSSQTRNA